MQAALLIGPIVHARPQWEALSSLLTLKVCITAISPCLFSANDAGIPLRNPRRLPAQLQARPLRRRRGHLPLQHLDQGSYSWPISVYVCTPANRQFTGPFDAELLAALPASLRFICHNGAGYDNIDVGRCSARGIRVSSTPVAVNHATADVAMFLMIGALRQAYVPISALRGGMCRPAYVLATCLREPDRQLAREDYARPRSPA